MKLHDLIDSEKVNINKELDILPSFIVRYNVDLSCDFVPVRVA